MMPLVNYFLNFILFASDVTSSNMSVDIINEKPLTPTVIYPLPLDLDGIGRFDISSTKGCNNFVLSGPYSDMFTSLNIVKHIKAPHYIPDSSVAPYYDVVIDDSSSGDENDGVIVSQLASLKGFDIYLAVAKVGDEKGTEVMKIVTYKNDVKIDEHILLYSFFMKAGHAYSYVKDPDIYAYINLFFQIDKNYIISTYMIDFNYHGEEVKCGSTRKEQWAIHPSGQFVRYYAKSGAFKNHEEEGKVVNHYRHGLWIETKPNKHVRKMTYLESYFYHGLPVGQWKYYDYTGGKKGELLYTEEYGS